MTFDPTSLRVWGEFAPNPQLKSMGHLSSQLWRENDNAPLFISKTEALKSILVRWLCTVFERQRISAAPALSCNCECYTAPVLLGCSRTSTSGALGVARPDTPGFASLHSVAGPRDFPSHSCMQFLSRQPAQGLFSCSSTVSSMSLKPWGPYWSLHPSVVLTQLLRKPQQPLSLSLPASCPK